MAKLNKNAQKWVRALRSGVFQQGKDALSQDGKYCCLGVACFLAAMEGVIPPPVRRNIDHKLEFDHQANYLPISVRNWLGLRSINGDFHTKHDEINLARLNDEGTSFAGIARIIESKPKGLFVTKRRKS